MIQVKTEAILPTAGSGTRMETDIPKPFLNLQSKPIFLHTLEVFDKNDLIEGIILVVAAELKERYEEIISAQSITTDLKIIEGGLTRKESVSRGLAQLDIDTDVVVVHDGARPLISQVILTEAINACKSQEAVIVAVPVTSTIKISSEDELTVKGTVSRDNLWEVQTPQVFKKEILVKAHAQGNNDATDDSVLVEQLGVKVGIVRGDYKNIKVTTQEDLTMAEGFLSAA